MEREYMMKAIVKLAPNCEWSLSGDNFEDIVVHSGQLPSKVAVEAEAPKIEKAEQDAIKAAEAKLAALGLTRDDLRLLGI